MTQSLAPGESITLNSDALVADTAYSRWPGYFALAGTHALYALADSYAEGGAAGVTGAVDESDEGNNMQGPLTVSVSANNALQMSIAAEGGQQPAADAAPLKPR